MSALHCFVFFYFQPNTMTTSSVLLNATSLMVEQMTTTMIEVVTDNEDSHSSDAQIKIFDTHELTEPVFVGLLGTMLFVLCLSLIRVCLHSASKLDFLPESGWLILLGVLIGAIVRVISTLFLLFVFL